MLTINWKIFTHGEIIRRKLAYLASGLSTSLRVDTSTEVQFNDYTLNLNQFEIKISLIIRIYY